MSIERLSQIDALDAADQIPVGSLALGGDARVSLSVLAAYVRTILPSLPLMETQYAAPSASGFQVEVAPTTEGGSVYLKLTPAAAYAAGEIILPTPLDGQEIAVNTTQAITALSITNGDKVGAPTTLAANGFFRLRYEGVLRTWNRIG